VKIDDAIFESRRFFRGGVLFCQKRIPGFFVNGRSTDTIQGVLRTDVLIRFVIRIRIHIRAGAVAVARLGGCLSHWTGLILLPAQLAPDNVRTHHNAAIGGFVFHALASVVLFL